MNRIEIQSTVGSDGVLNVTVPIGKRDANAPVRVTIEPLAGRNGHSGEPWREFLRRTYGCCAGLGFDRGDQGEFEAREPMK